MKKKKKPFLRILTSLAQNITFDGLEAELFSNISIVKNYIFNCRAHHHFICSEIFSNNKLFTPAVQSVVTEALYYCTFNSNVYLWVACYGTDRFVKRRFNRKSQFKKKKKSEAYSKDPALYRPDANFGH